MKIHRIYGTMLRYVFVLRHNLDRVADMFYWPILDLLLWGVTSMYFQKFVPDASWLVLSIVSGITLWLMVWRGQYELPMNLLEDIWNKNLVNMFVSPLSVKEWMIASLIMGILKGLVSFAFAGFLSFILYQVNVFSLGVFLLPFVALLLMSGWWIGFMVTALILWFGRRMQALAWTFAWVLAPFSLVYYPLSALPPIAQKISLILPTSYIFEGMREVLTTGNIDISKLVLSFILNLLYLAISLFFLKKAFQKILRQGLIKLY